MIDNAPTDIVLSGGSLRENSQAGATIGTLSSIIPVGTSTFAYSLVSGAGSEDNNRFAIDGTALKAATSFSFEDKASYSIRIRTTDALGGSFEKSFTISIIDLPELVTAPIIGDGTRQRSRVQSIVMRFDGAVVLDPGAFQLIRHGTNQVVNTIATQTQLPGGQVQVAINIQRICHAWGRFIGRWLL